MKKSVIILLVILPTQFLFSQKEANHWIFGSGTWLDFNFDPPVSQVYPDSVFETPLYSPTSISDNEGNLLFYGNRSYFKTPFGDTIAYQIFTNYSMFLPQYDNVEKYHFIRRTTFQSKFSIGHADLRWSDNPVSFFNSNGIFYDGSVIDDYPSKILAIKHSNQKDIWLINAELYQRKFNSRKLIGESIDTSVVISEFSMRDSNNIIPLRGGQIKANHKGTKIAIANQYLSNGQYPSWEHDGILEVYDFNRLTGALSNLLTYDFGNIGGVEFSLSGNYLYGLGGNIDTTKILQLNLMAGDSMAIVNSAEIMNLPGIGNGQGELQIAPNGKIYVLIKGTDKLGVIEYPDSSGLVNNFTLDGPDYFGGPDDYRFPTFFHSYTQLPHVEIEGTCIGDSTTFTLDDFPYSIDSVRWVFGDSLSGNSNFSTELNPSHYYAESGMYFPYVEIYSGNFSFLKENTVSIIENSLDIGMDVEICAGETFTIDAYIPNATYTWSDGSTSSLFQVTEAGTYSVEAIVDDCPVLEDTIVITHLPIPEPSQLPDLVSFNSFCQGDSLTIDASISNGTYQWSNGQTDSVLTVTNGGIYYVTITSSNDCQVSRSIWVGELEIGLSPNPINVTCYGDSNGVAMVTSSTFDSTSIPQVFWQDTIESLTLPNVPAGDYNVTVNHIGCTESTVVTVNEPDLLELNLTTEIDFFKTDPDGSISIEAMGGTPPYSYQIDGSTFQDTSFFDSLSFGIYNVMVLDSNGCEVTSIAMIDSLNTSINVFEKENNISVYPNPTSRQITIEFQGSAQGEFDLSIINMEGKEILRKDGAIFLENKYNLDLNLAGGMYQLMIDLDGEKYFHFFVFKN